MPELDTIEDTLFVPMLGRIYASEKFPKILNDKKALELKDKLPKDVKGKDTQTQYTFMASAVRSALMDRRTEEFLSRNPEGVVVLLGCGLETNFYRCDNGKASWYYLDMPDVIDYRQTLLPCSDREHCIPGDAFTMEWVSQVQEENPGAPMLVVASGVFMYFEKERVLNLMRGLQGKKAEVVFDVFNKSGMKRVHKYMEQAGHADAKMYFYLDDAAEFVREIGGDARLIVDDKFYKTVDKKGMTVSTKFTMKGADLLSVVKLVQIGL